MLTTSHMAFGIVRINDTYIGVPIDQLSEVCRIEGLSALPVKSDLLLGGFDLRNNAIPVLNFNKIAGLPDSTNTSKLMVIVKHKMHLLAFSIDEICGITQTSNDDIHSLQGCDATTKTHYSGLFTQNEKFISVLDIEALFNLPDVYAVTRPLVNDVKIADEARVSMLVFETGQALFSVPAIDVFAAVPRQEIQKTAITGGACLGEVSYYDRRIPVICPIAFFGVGTAREYNKTQIVVLSFPNDTVLGLAVDSVRAIEAFSSTETAKMPIWLEEECYIKGVTTQADERQVFEIDLPSLRTNKAAKTLASFSSSVVDCVNDQGTALDISSKDIVHEHAKYLVVEAGTRVAIPLEDVTYILEPPKNITPSLTKCSSFRGYFARFGQSVALFDLCSITGNDDRASERERLLLTGEDERQVAFYVEKVIGIEHSEWRETTNPSNPTASVVKIATSDEPSVLPYLSLRSVLPGQILEKPAPT